MLGSASSTPAGRSGLAAFGVFAVALALLLSFDPFDRPLMLDPATWDYMSVEVARGLVPHRDVFLHKTPGAAFVGAFGAWVGGALGFEPVLGAHALFLVLGALGPALLFAVCRPVAGTAAALAAAVFLFVLDQWPTAAVEGVRPKIVTVDLGLLCLWAAARGRPWLAGVAGGASTLCWQPGLCFLVGALAAVDRRSLGAWFTASLRVAAGSLIPVAVLLAWLASNRAMDDFFAQAVGFNLDYIDTKATTASRTLAGIYRYLRHWNTLEVLLFAPAALACALGLARVPAGVLVSGAVYAGMLFVSFQSWPDTILVLPVAAAILGVGLVGLARACGGPALVGAVLALALFEAATPYNQRLRVVERFEPQRVAMRELGHGIDRDEPVVAISVPEFLLHTGRRNGWKWPYMWFGVDRFAADETPGRFGGVLADLEDLDPPLILVARRWNGPLRKQFNRWAARRYERTDVKIFPHKNPPIAVYRRTAERPELRTRL